MKAKLEEALRAGFAKMSTPFGDINLKFKETMPKSWLNEDGRYELQPDGKYKLVAEWMIGPDGEVGLYRVEETQPETDTNE